MNKQSIYPSHTKEAHKLYMREWRKKHPEYCESDRQYQKKAYLNNRKYHCDKTIEWAKAHPEVVVQRAQEYKVRHPKEYEARNNSHRLPMAKECELCPEDDKFTKGLQRHHPDYDLFWLFVTVCKACHTAIHHPDVPTWGKYNGSA